MQVQVLALPEPSGEDAFPRLNATIMALASDYASAAGGNQNIAVFDELWGYTSERSRRLWDEMVPPPTRRIAAGLTVSYAGFSAESELLESLHKRALQGAEIARDLRATDDGLLAFWSNRLLAPWQTESWREQMRASLRPAQYLRMIENQWVATESPFVSLEEFDRCICEELRPVIENRALAIWVGLDASYKHDSTAIVACSYDESA